MCRADWFAYYAGARSQACAGCIKLPTAASVYLRVPTRIVMAALDHDPIKLNQDQGLAFYLSIIFSKTDDTRCLDPPERGRLRLCASEQSGGQLAVDADERVELLALGIGHHRHGLVHYKQAEIGDVLTDGDRQGVFGIGGRYHEDRPELAIVEQRRIELGFLAIPAVDDGLQP